jgi:muconolactone delta-isomerase
MAQITIYLPDDIENKARKAAKARETSVSRWIAERVVDALQEVWPKGVLDAAGALPDFPDVEEIRAGYGKDSTREPIR